MILDVLELEGVPGPGPGPARLENGEARSSSSEGEGERTALSVAKTPSFGGGGTADATVGGKLDIDPRIVLGEGVVGFGLEKFRW